MADRIDVDRLYDEANQTIEDTAEQTLGIRMDELMTIPELTQASERANEAIDEGTYHTQSIGRSVVPGPLGSLAMKIARVMGDMGHVPKNGYNQHAKYYYATESDIADMARKVMAKHNLAMIPTIRDHHVETGQTRSGNTSYLTHVSMRFRIIDGDSGEWMEIDVIGAGQDTGEKGLYKAYSGAKKYALLMLFLISTGEDDPESNTEEQDTATYGRGQPDPSRIGDNQVITKDGEIADRITQNQIKGVHAAKNKAGISDDELHSKWLSHLYKVDSIKDLSKEQGKELNQFMRLVPLVEQIDTARDEAKISAAAEQIGKMSLMERPDRWTLRKVSSARQRLAEMEQSQPAEDQAPEPSEDEPSAADDPELTEAWEHSQQDSPEDGTE